MKLAMLALIALLLLLQYKLWFMSNGIMDAWQKQTAITKLHDENIQMQQKNNTLLADVQDLKQGNEAVEELARSELGMIKPGEKFYQIVR